MKKLLAILATVVMLQSCGPAYVSVRPTYSPSIRPDRPSSLHVWVGDGWSYNRQSRTYNQRNGHWATPNRNRSYHEGQWKSGRRGNHWVNGRWK